MLTLANIVRDPSAVTTSLELDNGTQLTLRPLVASDVHALADFLGKLSPETRRLSTFEGYDLEAANKLTDAISKYDKLRFVLDHAGSIVGLVELSFGLPADDVQRYADYGLELDGQTDCRFGPTLADAYQGKGIGSKVFPLIASVAREFGKKRIILWGGVLADNTQAIAFYNKVGFTQVGEFNDHGRHKLDMALELETRRKPIGPS
jgi:GNAT superfamily N-acetyltransferase